MHRFSGGNISPGGRPQFKSKFQSVRYEMRVTVLLGGHLRTEAHKGPMERIVELARAGARRRSRCCLGLARNRVKIIFVNSRASTLSTLLHEGDRVALFPPELSYNTFVSLSYRQDRIEESK